MTFIVKTAKDERNSERRYRREQDALLQSIGMSREDFPCFEGIAVEDELVIVWARDNASWPSRPKNFVEYIYNGESDRFEYTFMARDEEYVGEPVVETYF